MQNCPIEPIVIQSPAWVWDGYEWVAPIGRWVRLVARPDTRDRALWRWEVQTSDGDKITVYRSSSATHHERTAEAAQVAAWDALGKWLGATP